MYEISKNYKAHSILEVIIAVALFTIIIAGILPFYMGVYETGYHDNDKLQSDMYLQQGLEAVRSIRDYNYANLTNGSYGLSRTNGYWEFFGISETLGKFTRTIIISDVQRDASCNIVESGGTTDSNSKKITVNISWNYEEGVPAQNNETFYLTNWKSSLGCEQSGNLLIDLSAAGLSSDEKRIEGIMIKNLSDTAIIVDKITPIWTIEEGDNDSLIEEVKIGSTIVWKYNGAGTPDGKQPSGVELDVENYTIPAQSDWITLNHFKFTEDMEGADFTIYFKMIDGTVNYNNVQIND